MANTGKLQALRWQLPVVARFALRFLLLRKTGFDSILLQGLCVETRYPADSSRFLLFQTLEAAGCARHCLSQRERDSFPVSSAMACKVKITISFSLWASLVKFYHFKW